MYDMPTSYRAPKYDRTPENTQPRHGPIREDASINDTTRGDEVATIGTSKTDRSIFSGSFWTAPTSMFWSTKSVTTLVEEERRRTYKESRYQKLIREKVLQQTRRADEPLDWSGSGQHIEVAPGKPVPCVKSRHVIAHTNRSLVEEVLCRRVRLVRKSTSVKRDRRDTSEQKLQEALSEVRQLSSLRHSHVIQLIGTYLQGDRFSMLLYPVADFDLTTFLEMCEDTEHLPMFRGFAHSRSLANGTVCLLDALRYVHENCIRHLDIKPQNVLVKFAKDFNVFENLDRPLYHFYLCDFGISKDFSDPNESKSEEPPARTATYCSPEIHKYEKYGRASDVFSLGCVFLEMWTVILGRRLGDFIDFRCAFKDYTEDPDDWPRSVDISFQGHLAGVFAWMDELKVNNSINPCADWVHVQQAMISWYRDVAWHEPNDRLDSEGIRNILKQRMPVGLVTVRGMLNANPAERPTLAELERKYYEPGYCCTYINPAFKIEENTTDD